MSVYKLSRRGLEPADPAVSWDAPTSRYRASGRVAGTRAVKRAVEDGWPVTDAMKALAMHALIEVLTDREAGARERVAAVAATIAMTRVNVSIDQAAGDGEKISTSEYLVELRRRIEAYEADPVPDRVGPACMDPDPMESGTQTSASPRRLAWTLYASEQRRPPVTRRGWADPADRADPVSPVRGTLPSGRTVIETASPTGPRGRADRADPVAGNFRAGDTVSGPGRSVHLMYKRS